MRRSWIGWIVAALIATGAAAATAHADGLPVLGIDVGGVGVTTPTDAAQFVTMHAGANTIVARVAKRGGRVLRSRLLKGNLTIPAVAYDGSAGGLAADARTLVLIEPRAAFPRADTTLLVLDAQRLAPRLLVKLQGDFSFDAISPHGRWMYLIQYLSATDPTRYRVRAYDTRAGRLVAQPVLDPRSRGEKMRGQPLSRALSPDGRWAYTLYDGAGSTPFIHALDTKTRAARCIDLDALAGRNDLWLLRLRADGSTVAVRGRHGSILTVDRRTFDVRTAAPFRWSVPLTALALSLAALLAAAATTLLLRRRRGRVALAHS